MTISIGFDCGTAALAQLRSSHGLLLGLADGQRGPLVRNRDRGGSASGDCNRNLHPVKLVQLFVREWRRKKS